MNQLVTAPRYLRSRGGELPTGMIVGWVGTVASIPTGWALCDGTGGTPNLHQLHVIHEDGTYTYDTPGGNATEDCGGTLASGGGHTGSPAAGGGTGGGVAGGTNSSSYGAHTHASVSATIDNDPPSHQYLPIMHTGGESRVPTGATLWFNGATAPSGFSADASLYARSMKFTTTEGDRDTATGTEVQSVTLTAAAGGAHTHVSGNISGDPTSALVKNVSAGSHTPNASESLTVDSYPPYYALLPIKADDDERPVADMIVPYYGLVASLPAGWSECDGAGGLPDMAGRIPIGFEAGGDSRFDVVGETGGAASRTVSGTITHSQSHSHQGGSTAAHTGYHHTFAWSHSHALSGSSIGLPKYHPLRYIIFTG